MYKNKNLGLYKLLLENIDVTQFFKKIHQKFPDSVYIMQFLKDFIVKSNCQKIEFAKFKTGIAGLSLEDGVYINEGLLNGSFSNFLYALFHEVAHQYQYKKYQDKIYDMYNDDIDILEAAKFMNFIEQVADDFAVRKIREINKLYGDKVKVNTVRKVYAHYTPQHFIPLIKRVRDYFKQENVDDQTDVSEMMYNLIKNM